MWALVGECKKVAASESQRTTDGQLRNAGDPVRRFRPAMRDSRSVRSSVEADTARSQCVGRDREEAGGDDQQNASAGPRRERVDTVFLMPAVAIHGYGSLNEAGRRVVPVGIVSH